jgi:hypothetical protein
MKKIAKQLIDIKKAFKRKGKRKTFVKKRKESLTEYEIRQK